MRVVGIVLIFYLHSRRTTVLPGRLREVKNATGSLQSH